MRHVSAQPMVASVGAVRWPRSVAMYVLHPTGPGRMDRRLCGPDTMSYPTSQQPQKRTGLPIERSAPGRCICGRRARNRSRCPSPRSGAPTSTQWWTRRHAYRAPAAGGWRYDLGGEPCGEVSKEHRLPVPPPPRGCKKSFERPGGPHAAQYFPQSGNGVRLLQWVNEGRRPLRTK
jgi:hypothetical protein